MQGQNKRDVGIFCEKYVLLIEKFYYIYSEENRWDLFFEN